MGRVRNLPAVAFAGLLVAAAVGSYVTRDAAAPASKPAAPAAQTSLMDQRLVQSARSLGATAETPDERAFAAEALRIADHELGQAFATALREAAGAAVALPPNLQQLAARVQQLRTAVSRDQSRIAQLTGEAPASDSLSLARAQLALDQDELDDAQQDLARQGGDARANLERAIQEHEAAQKAGAETPPPARAAPSDTLNGHLRQWLDLGAVRRRLADAEREAAAKAASLNRQHARLEASRRPADAWPDPFEDVETSVVIERLKRVSDQTKTMRELDARTQDAQQLAQVYAKWQAEVDARRTVEAHDLLRTSTFIFAVLLAAVLGTAAIRRGIGPQTDRRRAHQLRFMATLAVQLAAAAIVLLLIFGPPTQISTIIGLITAGLTVVLKDFIMAFFGWFVLMGRNGIRIGDWVEINGVSGEVVEISLLRTVLLEMGNWPQGGAHPTGRRAGFINSFAIEGHYFNFSTAGQWLWDELRVAVPRGDDPYRIAEEIRAAVEQATDADATEAGVEWERVTHQYGTRAFSARPTVDLRPTGGGLEIVVRYITRAPQRDERKSRLYQEIIALLHGRGAASDVGA